MLISPIIKGPRCGSRAVSHPVDAHVGERIKFCRRRAGLSQAELADRIGLTFQQVQKYERGANRVSASKLFEISQALGVRVAYFFDELPGQTTSDGNPLLFVSDPMTRDVSLEAMTLIEAWPNLQTDARQALLKLVSLFAADQAA